MSIRSLLAITFSVLVASTSPAPCLARGSETSVAIGFFEGGSYPQHSEFRNFLRDQLKGLAPAGVEIVYPASGFKSADWNRDQSRAMARELAADTSIDLVVALGPWTVEDLRAAGFDRPIVAAQRFDPVAEGLADRSGTPVQSNLTVRVRPDKIVSDLTYLTQLKRFQRLGVLYFPSGEHDSLYYYMQRIAEQGGFEVVTAEGFDREGTYAFFKAYQALDKDIDALYLPPLWGLDPQKIRGFYEMVAADGIPAFSSDGEYHCLRGALASGSFESPRVAALYTAWKIIQIINGATPADLITLFADHSGLTVNEVVAREVNVGPPPADRTDVQIVPGPAADNVERLTVVDAVNLALMQNPGYRSKYEALEAAARAASKARAAYLPHVSASASYFHFDDNSVNNDPRFENDRFRAGLRLEQEILSLGAIRDAQIASANRDLSEIDLRRAGLDLELGVTVAFLNCLRARQTAALEVAEVKKIRECMQIARFRDQSGLGTAADAIRCENEWLNAEQDEIAARADLEAARVMLNALLGRPGDYPFVLDDRGLNDPAFFAEQALLTRYTASNELRRQLIDSLVNVASAQSIDLGRIDTELRRQQTALARNEASFMPRIGFRASLDVVDKWAPHPGFEEKNPVWAVGAVVELPLLLGGARIQERGALRAELGGLQFGRDQLSLEVASRVRQETAGMLGLALNFPLAARAAELAQQHFPLILGSYSVGQCPITDLLDAVYNDRQSTLRAINTQIEYFQATARIARSLCLPVHEKGLTPGEAITHLFTD